MSLTETICAEIANRQRKQADIAFLYACAIAAGDAGWPEINRAILKRWSMSGLESIKAKAWKITQGSKTAVVGSVCSEVNKANNR